MQSEIKTYKYSDGEIQRTQIVHLDSWDGFSFVKPEYSQRAFEQFCYIYENFIIASFPMIFGQMLLFTLPEDKEINIPNTDHEYEEISDRFVLASMALNKGVKIINHQPVFSDAETERFYHELEDNKCLKVISGKRKYTKIIPVSHECGFLSEAGKEKVKVNTSFFIMDFVDIATVFDSIGTPVGLMLKDGKIIDPPLFDRETLLVDKNNNVTIKKIRLDDLRFEINGKECSGYIYSRPDYRKTPKCDKDNLVIIGNKVKAIKHNGNCPVPASGFVLRIDKGHDIKAEDTVVYKGLEQYRFALQVGNSAIIDGVPIEEFISPFYNLYKLGTSYPPGLYPHNYKKDRAARVLLGSDKDNRPVLVWAEGAGKFGHIKGKESCGASLLEMAQIAKDIGLMNAINLDGGGSAEILIDDLRQLRLTDRNKENDRELERAIPAGLSYGI